MSRSNQLGRNQSGHGAIHALLSFVLIFSASFGLAKSAPPLLNLSPGFQALQKYETQANAVSKRSDSAIAIEHYEVPLDFLQSDIADHLAPEIRDSLIFEKRGRKFVRWVINPEDTLWHPKIAEFLRAKGLSDAKQHYFTGYQTASRSYLVRDPNNGAEFSVKVSTDHSGGIWTDKVEHWSDARQERLTYRYADEVLSHQAPLQHALIMDEPAAFGLLEVDQAMIIRTYDVLKNPGLRLVPGFSIMHDEAGRQLAIANGSNDPAKYWDKHYNQPLAVALAEVAALTGLTFDSPHSQNFLVEVDADNHPTGRIALRDIGDSYLNKEIAYALGQKRVVKELNPDYVIANKLQVSIGVLHGNKDPSWLKTSGAISHRRIFKQWGQHFYDAFEQEFKALTHFDIAQTIEPKPILDKKYFFKYYDLTSGGAKDYITRLGNHEVMRSGDHGVCQIAFGQAS